MKPLIIANWKMNPQTLQEAKQLFKSVVKGIRNIKDKEAVICPPSLYLLELSCLKRENRILNLGAQDVFWENPPSGARAYTGELSVSMLKSAGSKYVIVGHSERRRYFRETDEMINKKIKAVLSGGLNPILCIGETKEEKDRGKTKDILKKQIKLALKGISSHKLQASGFYIAYEPIWAIGSGNSCGFEQAKEVAIFIRKIISSIYNVKIAKKVNILYGGSVNSKNAENYIKKGSLDGLLVGGASLNAKEFIKILKL